jgi:CheY-like chemotaxis protein
VKLLIVEDNIKIREMLKNMFKEYFTNIYECDDGAFALENYVEHKPDWVFMDIKMKNMDGIEAAKQILEFFPQAKVIMVTDFNDVNFKKKSTEAGASGYVLKENLSEIFDIINTH